jgi:hypothetical protein
MTKDELTVRKSNKWRPIDGAPTFEKFSDADWVTIKPHLPSEASADARQTLEQRGRRLWDLRAGRVKRASSDDLMSLANTLRKAEKLCRTIGWDGETALLQKLALRANQDWKLSLAYKRNSDPDREEFYFAVLLDYQNWGGDLGKGAEYVPRALMRFFSAVCNAVLGREAPKSSSIPDIVGRLRRTVRIGSTSKIALDDTLITVFRTPPST